MLLQTWYFEKIPGGPLFWVLLLIYLLSFLENILGVIFYNLLTRRETIGPTSNEV